MNIGYDTVGFVLLFLIAVPLLIWNPRLLLYGLIVLTIDDSLLPDRIQVGQINLYLQDIIFFLLFFFALYVAFNRLIHNKKIITIPKDGMLVFILFLLYIVLHISYIVLGLTIGIPFESVLRRFSIYSGCFYFLFPFLFISNNKQLRNLLIFVVIISILNPMWQIYNFAKMPEWARAYTSSGTIRLGSGGMTIIASALFSMLIWKKNLKYYILTLFPILSMVLVAHRSVLLALGGSLLFYFFFTKELTKSLLFVYLAGFSLILALTTSEMITGHNFLDDAISRASDTFDAENTTTVARINAIEINLSVFKKKPFGGIGYDYEFLKNLFPPSTPEGEQMRGVNSYYTVGEYTVLHPHNFILRFLSQTGIFGLTIIITIIFTTYKRCFSLISEKGSARDIGILLFCSITFFLIISLMNTTFFTEGWIFWILCGTIVFFSRKYEFHNESNSLLFGQEKTG